MAIIVHITDRHILYLKMYMDRVSINIKNTIKHTFKVVNFFLFNLENHLQYIQRIEYIDYISFKIGSIIGLRLVFA